jgi:hypothetical protein
MPYPSWKDLATQGALYIYVCICTWQGQPYHLTYQVAHIYIPGRVSPTARSYLVGPGHSRSPVHIYNPGRFSPTTILSSWKWAVTEPYTSIYTWQGRTFLLKGPAGPRYCSRFRRLAANLTPLFLRDMSTYSSRPPCASTA